MMLVLQVIKYSPKYYDSWNEFVLNSVNGTFLFHRDFMEYHSDRFDDYSLMVFDNDKLVAVFPANIHENTVYSHQGLTYGGLVIKVDTMDKYELYYKSIVDFLQKQDIHKLIIKKPSKPYLKYLDTNVFLKDYKLINKEWNAILDYSDYTISKSKLKHYQKNNKQDFKLVQNDNFQPFWDNVLTPLLLEKYNTKPIHNLKEIEYLKSKFPDNIIQYSLYYRNKIVGGITLFVHQGYMVKSQYGATTDLGKKIRVMDYLFIELISKYKNEGYSYFDMGTATDPRFEEGFNPGLLNQKKELGCTCYKQAVYEIKL